MNANATQPPGRSGVRPGRYAGMMACPHCSGPLRIRSSATVTSLVRYVLLQCGDLDCGATFGANLGITHAITPSANPDPEVNLRRAPPRRRPANDTVPPRFSPPGGPEVPPANDRDDDVKAPAGT